MVAEASAAEKAAIAQLVKAARGRGEDITGPEGLLKSITATVLEAALEEEITDHLGHAKHQAPEGGAVNIRNGTRPKTVLTDAAGEVTIEVPRDRAGTFEPVIVKKRQRRLNDVDAVAISLFAKGLTTGEISAATTYQELATALQLAIDGSAFNGQLTATLHCGGLALDSAAKSVISIAFFFSALAAFGWLRRLFGSAGALVVCQEFLICL